MTFFVQKATLEAPVIPGSSTGLRANQELPVSAVRQSDSWVSPLSPSSTVTYGGSFPLDRPERIGANK